MRKRCKRKHWRDAIDDTELAARALVGSSAPADAIRKAEVARLYAQLEKLRTGALTPAGFGSIRWVSFWLFEITATIRERSANDETTAWVREQRRQINGFVTAIATIGQRHEDRGRYVASGDELRALDTMASMASAILSIITVGEYYAAALRADALDRELQRRMVRNWLADQVSELERETA